MVTYFNLFFFFFFYRKALDGLPFGTERTGGCPSYRAELKAKDNMSRMNALYPQTNSIGGKDMPFVHSITIHNSQDMVTT